jgi:site-specific DNA-cytosine methylase
LYIENVPEFTRWGELKDGKRVKGKEGLEYLRWITTIKNLGYVNYDRRFLNAADYGCPTRRIRYFGIFSKAGCPIVWPRPTHAEKENLFGLPKWVPCKNYINLQDEGRSIFGRDRGPLSINTLKRLAGGIKKFAPEIFFIMSYYGNGDNCQSINKPLNTITTKERHCIVKVEKCQFIQDYCHQDRYDQIDKPMSTLLTWQTKQLITVEKTQTKQLVTAEKSLFISSFFPRSEIKDFDIKMRFLYDWELASIMGFPEGYFHKPGMKISTKEIIKMIGNAVPVGMAKALLEPMTLLLIENIQTRVAV